MLIVKALNEEGEQLGGAWRSWMRLQEKTVKARPVAWHQTVQAAPENFNYQLLGHGAGSC